MHTHTAGHRAAGNKGCRKREKKKKSELSSICIFESDLSIAAALFRFFLVFFSFSLSRWVISLSNLAFCSHQLWIRLAQGEMNHTHKERERKKVTLFEQVSHTLVSLLLLSVFLCRLLSNPSRKTKMHGEMPPRHTFRHAQRSLYITLCFSPFLTAIHFHRQTANSSDSCHIEVTRAFHEGIKSSEWRKLKLLLLLLLLPVSVVYIDTLFFSLWLWLFFVTSQGERRRSKSKGQLAGLFSSSSEA